MNKHLALVISKIQFGTIPERLFGEAISLIQDRLRKEYPNFSSRDQIQIMDVKINSNTGEQSVNRKSMARIGMTSADMTWGIQIMPDNLILFTTQYTCFDDFFSRMESVLQVAHEALDISHTSFIGIRYLNKLALSGEESEAHLIQRQEFLQPNIGTYTLGGSNLTARYQTDLGWLNINSGVTINAPKYSPDLYDLVAEWQPENEILNGPWAHVDIDSFNGQKQLSVYDKDIVMSQLKKLREHAKKAYISIVND
nr:TIGR04255 family protein [uncultured Vibrio sp.]